jgi:hypothetical protein
MILFVIFISSQVWLNQSEIDKQQNQCQRSGAEKEEEFTTKITKKNIKTQIIPLCSLWLILIHAGTLFLLIARANMALLPR